MIYIYIDLGSYDLALKQYFNALDIRNSILASNHPLIAETLQNIGRIYESKKDFSQALEYFQKSRSIFRRAYPANHDKVTQIEDHIRRISSNSK